MHRIFKTLNKLNPGYMMKFLHLEIQTDYLEKNINKTWTFQKPIKLLLEQEPSGATFRQFGICLTLTYKNFSRFKSFQRHYQMFGCLDGNHCTCRVCKNTTSRQQTLTKTKHVILYEK